MDAGSALRRTGHRQRARAAPQMAVLVIGGAGLTGKECVYQALERGEDVVALCRSSKITKPAGSCGADAAETPLTSDKLTVVSGTVTSKARVFFFEMTVSRKEGSRLFTTTQMAPPVVLRLPSKGGRRRKEGSRLFTTQMAPRGGAAVSCTKADVEKAFAAAASPVTGVVIALGGKTKDVGDTMLTDGTKVVIDVMKANDVKRVSVVTSIGAGDSKDQAPFFFKILMATAMKKIFSDKNNQEALFAPGGPGAGLEFTVVRPGGLTVDAPTGVVNVIDGEAGSIPRADVADFCLGAVLDEEFPYLGKYPCISSVGGTSWVKDRSGAARGEMA